MNNKKNNNNEVIWHRNDAKFEILAEEHPDFPGCHRIRATKSFGSIKKGQLGGFVSRPENLDFTDLSWIYKRSVVMGELTHVCGYVTVKDSIIKGSVTLFGSDEDLSDGGIHVKGSILNGNISIQGDSIFITNSTISNRRRQASQFWGFIVMKTCYLQDDCYLMSQKEPFLMEGVAGQVSIPEMITSRMDDYIQWKGSYDRKPDFGSVIPNASLDLNELTKLNWR